MNIDYITEKIKEFPSEIRDIFMKSLLTMALAGKKVETDNLHRSDQDLFSSSGSISQEKDQNTLLSSFLKGNVTNETKKYAERFYRILEESDKYSYNGVGHDENGNRVLIREDKNETFIKRQQQLNSIGDGDNNYGLEYTITNKNIGFLNGEIINNNNGLREILCNRNGNPRFTIENLTESVHIKNIAGNQKLLEFYTLLSNQHPLFKEIVRNPNYLSDFDRIALTKVKYKAETKYYEVLNYDSMNIWNGKIVLKYKVNFLE